MVVLFICLSLSLCIITVFVPVMLASSNRGCCYHREPRGGITWIYPDTHTYTQAHVQTHKQHTQTLKHTDTDMYIHSNRYMIIYTRIHTKHSQTDGKREVQSVGVPLLTNGKREGPSLVAPSPSLSNGRREGPSLVAPSPSLTNGMREGPSLVAPSSANGRREGLSQI